MQYVPSIAALVLSITTAVLAMQFPKLPKLPQDVPGIPKNLPGKIPGVDKLDTETMRNYQNNHKKAYFGSDN